MAMWRSDVGVVGRRCWTFTSDIQSRRRLRCSCGWRATSPRPGKFVYQATSEIESITSIVGSGFAGKKAMTATAGPGFSLMGEGLGLAWMAEIPLVVADIQRGGPSTGLPTKTEQSDLMTAMYPGSRGHAATGDCSRYGGRVLLRRHPRASTGQSVTRVR